MEEVGRRERTLSVGRRGVGRRRGRAHEPRLASTCGGEVFLHTLSPGFAKYLVGCLSVRRNLQCTIFHVSYFCFCMLLLESV
jgi:hypothetical protein